LPFEVPQQALRDLDHVQSRRFPRVHAFCSTSSTATPSRAMRSERNVTIISCARSKTSKTLDPSERELAAVLGSRIRELRERRGLSQRLLSQQLRLSKSMVAKYEGGVHTPPTAVLVRLATVLGASVDSLLGRDPRDSPLAAYLAEIDAMDATSRELVVSLLELTLKVHRLMRQRLRAETVQ
jgi:transcriptional regulator with XRE-family HTH domain